MSSDLDSEQQTRQRREIALKAAATRRQIPVRAEIFLRAWQSFSSPVAVLCNDGLEYVIKGRQVGRAIVNDQVIANLGIAMGAPVGKPRLVEIVPELIQVEPRLAHVSPGIAHGTLFERDCSDRSWIAYSDEPVNRARFAAICVLYGWAHANDHQLIYSNTTPHLVYSVDHGHFFPGGPDWTLNSLQQCSTAQLESTLTIGCSLSDAEISEALQALASITESQIIEAVAAPPDEWGITIDERLALVEYFVKRQSELLMTSAGGLL